MKKLRKDSEPYRVLDEQGPLYQSLCAKWMEAVQYFRGDFDPKPPEPPVAPAHEVSDADG